MEAMSLIDMMMMLQDFMVYGRNPKKGLCCNKTVVLQTIAVSYKDERSKYTEECFEFQRF